MSHRDPRASCGDVPRDLQHTDEELLARHLTLGRLALAVACSLVAVCIWATLAQHAAAEIVR